MVLEAGLEPAREKFPTDFKSVASAYSAIRANLNYGGGRGIRTPVGLHPNGFQDRPVMTASVSLHKKKI